MDRNMITIVRIIGILTFGWLLFIDWRIGIAIFIMLWTNNFIERIK